MSLNIDGFAVLGAISANANVFDGIKASDVIKAASGLALKALKARSTNLEKVREIHRALGADSFRLIAQEMTDAQRKTLLGKIDKHQPKAKDQDSLWRLRHLYALANGSEEPAPRPAPVSRAARSPRRTDNASAKSPVAKKSAKKSRSAADENNPTKFVSAGKTRD
jgi:hypothetical protein